MSAYKYNNKEIYKLLTDIVNYFLNNINNENIFNKDDITKHNRAI